jgi:hypothetical protein
MVLLIHLHDKREGRVVEEEGVNEVREKVNKLGLTTIFVVKRSSICQGSFLAELEIGVPILRPTETDAFALLQRYYHRPLQTRCSLTFLTASRGVLVACSIVLLGSVQKESLLIGVKRVRGRWKAVLDDRRMRARSMRRAVK